MSKDDPIILHPKVEHTNHEIANLEDLLKMILQFVIKNHLKPYEATVSEWLHAQIVEDMKAYGGNHWDYLHPVLRNLVLVVRGDDMVVIREDKDTFFYSPLVEMQRKKIH